jgi:cadmium resistance protein CadD (predicted permease)
LAEVLPLTGLLGLVALAFASTNLDNLLLLVSWQVGGGIATGRLFGSYVLGMTGVLILAVVLGLVGYLFPVEYLGYLGIVPIIVGLRLLALRRGGESEAPRVGIAGVSAAGVAATQLSNGVDTVLVFAPLLADSLVEFDLAIVVLFLVMIVLWFLLAGLLSRHLARLTVVSSAERWIAPVVMIVVGVYIVANTATDLTPQ